MVEGSKICTKSVSFGFVCLMSISLVLALTVAEAEVRQSSLADMARWLETTSSNGIGTCQSDSGLLTKWHAHEISQFISLDKDSVHTPKEGGPAVESFIRFGANNWPN